MRALALVLLTYTKNTFWTIEIKVPWWPVENITVYSPPPNWRSRVKCPISTKELSKFQTSSGKKESGRGYTSIRENTVNKRVKKRTHLLLLFHYEPDQPKNQTLVLGHSLVRSLALLTRLLAPPCSLRSRAPLHSLARSLTSLTPSLMGK